MSDADVWDEKRWDELGDLGRNLDRRVRCLLIYCARCDLKVLRVERNNRDTKPSYSTFGALWTWGGLYVSADGAREFDEFRPEPQAAVPDRTFTWRCPHGHPDSRRLERFLRAWPQHDKSARHDRILHLKLGRDL